VATSWLIRFAHFGGATDEPDNQQRRASQIERDAADE
jgi:hypothetical protein